MKPIFLSTVFALLITTTIAAQDLRTFNQNASRSNHTRISFAPDQNGLYFQLNGSSQRSANDSIGTKGSLMPAATARYFYGNWGLGVEGGSFASNTPLAPDQYAAPMRGFTRTDIHSTEWKSWFVLAGPSFRKSIGTGLQLNADMKGGMVKMKPASFTITDQQSGALIADYNNQTKQSSNRQALLAVKPTLGLEWFPGNGPIGFNLHAGYMQAMGAKEITVYYRDLSKVNFAQSQQEVRFQVLNAPVKESRTKGPVANYSFGAGISIRIPPGKSINEKGVKRTATDMPSRISMNVTTPKQSARTAGTPIGDIVVKGGKNPGGNNLRAVTDENGKINIKIPESGDYSFIISEPETTAANSEAETKLPPRTYTGGRKNENAQRMEVPYTGNSATIKDFKIMIQASGTTLADGTPVVMGKTVSGTISKPGGAASASYAAGIVIKQPETGDEGSATADETGNFRIVLHHDTLHRIFINNQEYGKIKIIDTGMAAAKQTQGSTFGEKVAQGLAAKPGNPIGGIIVKGGKNPGGNSILAVTDNNGRIDLNGLEAGEYSFTVMTPETAGTQQQSCGPVTQKTTYPDGRIEENTFSCPADAAAYTQKVQAGLNSAASALANGSGLAKQHIDPATDAAPETRAQNNNTVRSNRTDNALMGDDNTADDPVQKIQNNNTIRSNRSELKSVYIAADMDGDGSYETDITNQINDVVIMDENGNVAPQQKAGISTSRSHVRTRSALVNVGNGVYTCTGTAIINGREVKISNVLKTKHDTVKNSINNVR